MDGLYCVVVRMLFVCTHLLLFLQQDAEDMFGVFARFNLLLTRTRVRAAVKEFQIQLISTVSQAVSKLQGKFTLKYESSEAARISRLKGIPPVAGKILWAKQMERQVHTLMDRMGNVLGPNWGQQLEGRQLRKSGDELLAKLDARAFFRSWVAEWEKQITSTTTSRLHSYPIIIEPERNGELIAKVNFDEKSELLFKEIRHLKWLGFGKDIPKTLTMVSDEAVGRYPVCFVCHSAEKSSLQYSHVGSRITVCRCDQDCFAVVPGSPCSCHAGARTARHAAALGNPRTNLGSLRC